MVGKGTASPSSGYASGGVGRIAKTAAGIMTVCVMLAFAAFNLSVLKFDSCRPVRKRMFSLNSTITQLQASLTSSNDQLSITKRQLSDAEASLSFARSNASEVLIRANAAEARVKELEDTLQNQDNAVRTTQTTDLASMYARQNRKLPACARNGTRATAFLIVFMGHSGSTAILTELHNHEQVLRGYWEPVDHQEELNTTEALEMATDIFEEGVQKGLTAGFKIRPAHILAQPAQWRALAKRYGVRVIWQYRKNVFKGAVGEYAHRYLNDTTVVEGLRSNVSREERCQIGAGCKFRVEDFGFLHERVKAMVSSSSYISRAVAEIARDSKCTLEMPYEDYLYDREGSVNLVQDFLGLERQPTTPLRFKAMGDSMCETIENWDQVCDAFYGCVLWQHMLDDVRNNCFCRLSGGIPSGEYCDAV